jgi:hypothetical protein
MAYNTSPTVQVRATTAQIVDDQDGGGLDKYKQEDKYSELVKWVVAKTDTWRLWRNNQYEAKWNSYERQWRGEWSATDRLRQSERSKIVGPALSEAVENAAAEIEEATFGRGVDYFDVGPLYNQKMLPPAAEMPMNPMAAEMQAMGQPEMGMGQPEMGMLPMGPPPAPTPVVTDRDKVETVRGALKEDLALVDFASNTAMCILNSAVFGDGFAEIRVEDRKLREAITDEVTDMMTSKVTVRPIAGLEPVHPRNMLYDPNAVTLHKGLGCAIEENMSLHVILAAKQTGEFRKEAECSVETADRTLQGDQVTGAGQYEQDHVPVIKYFGLVPKKMLNPKDEKAVDLFPEDKKENESAEYEDGEYVEAIVVIANKKGALKVESNPYAMEDRPVVHFPWDRVPGRLSGRGICEKGLNSARILDAETRSRLDSLAYVTAPMVAMDATRVPRGFKLQVAPGKTILTSGPPSEALFPFKFGQLDPNHFQNAQMLQAMVQQATGSVDAAALAGGIGDARSGAVSMALAPVIKRYKRTMVHFLDLFLMPALEKIANRNMQYNPERYPTVALKFKAASTMGIMQREYETSQMTALLATMEPNTPPHRAVLLGIIGNSSVPNREEIMKMVRDEDGRQAKMAEQAMAAQQDPKMQQLQGVTIELQLAEAQAKIRKLNAEATLAEGKAEVLPMQVEIDAMAVGTKGMYAVPEDQQAAEWDRRMEYVDRELEVAKLDEQRRDRVSNEKITMAQMNMSAIEREKDRAHKEQLEARKAANKPTPKAK